MANLKVKNSVTAKLIIIGILSLVLLIPAFMIEDLIQERQQRKLDAQNEVSEKWGEHQTVSALVLNIPYFTYNTVTEDGNEKVVKTRKKYIILNLTGIIS